MLKLHFINVGGGDSILIEETGCDVPFRLLIDAGLPEMKPDPDSMRLCAADYLAEQAIRHLDALIVTHLHMDHQGGVQRLLDTVSVDRVYAGYFPADPDRLIPDEPDSVRTVKNMILQTNFWFRSVQRMRDLDIKQVPVTQSLSLPLTPSLRADIICPSSATAMLQADTWEKMSRGIPVDDQLKYDVSKSRNPNSLRIRLHYAGREIELSGDCYGCCFDGEELAPCDIFKVPHHADQKSLTPLLVQKLRPQYAVVSCSRTYDPRKDRPSEMMLALLRENGTRVWFTDSFPTPWQQPADWQSVDITIDPNGTIHVPNEAYEIERLEPQ